MSNSSSPALTPEQWQARDYRQSARELDSWAKTRGDGASGDDSTEYVAKLGLTEDGSVIAMNRATTGCWSRRPPGRPWRPSRWPSSRSALRRPMPRRCSRRRTAPRKRQPPRLYGASGNGYGRSRRLEVQDERGGEEQPSQWHQVAPHVGAGRLGRAPKQFHGLQTCALESSAEKSGRPARSPMASSRRRLRAGAASPCPVRASAMASDVI